jgi:hypothetical protein
MKVGFSIVVGGDAFDPEAAIAGCYCQPDVIARKGELLPNGNVSPDSFVEWGDWHEGTYPLDMVTEALDLLIGYKEEFSRICHSPGVEYRSLLFGQLGSNGDVFNFSADQVRLLDDLGFDITITVMPVTASG